MSFKTLRSGDHSCVTQRRTPLTGVLGGRTKTLLFNAYLLIYFIICLFDIICVQFINCFAKTEYTSQALVSDIKKHSIIMNLL